MNRMSSNNRRHVATCAALLVSSLVFACAAAAQINGVPASVTSMGFGGQHNWAPGVPASVTSLGPNGFSHGRAFPNCCVNPWIPANPNPPLFQGGRHHGNHFPVSYPFYGYGYGYAGYSPVVVVQQPVLLDADYNYDDDESGGPTIFDRRGSGIPRKGKDRVADRDDEAAPPSSEAKAPEPLPVADQPQTILVFKDGHRSEVRNYAIVGDTLFDFTGVRHKIALADLDIPKTVKENDERGLDFKVPANLAR